LGVRLGCVDRNRFAESAAATDNAMAISVERRKKTTLIGD